MKAKYALIALLAITFFGCDDNTGELGLGMFPGSDQNIKGKLTTFDVTTESVPTGKVYAKTNIGYVGKFTDETFGTYQAGFLAELHCPDGLTFPKLYKETQFDSDGKATKAEGVIVTDFSNIELSDESKKTFQLITDGNGNVIGNCQINFYLTYSSYFGDSLTASRLSLYELDQNLNQKTAYYTNIDPELYYNSEDPDALLGTKAYTAVDLSVSESDRNSSTYSPNVSLRLKKEITEKLGKRILSAAKEHGVNFSDYFKDLFKGIYVKSDYGDGTVLYIDQVQMDMVSVRYVTDSISGVKLKSKANKDSVTFTGRTFATTREVIQANQLTNDEEAIKACINETNCTYLKTPTGIFTQATLPIDDITKDLVAEGDTLNAVKLTFTNYNQSTDKKFGMSVPSRVMLIRKKLKESFFEKNQLSDGISSYLASHSSSNQYTFANITKLITACIADRNAAVEQLKSGNINVEKRNENGDVITVPVSTIKEWEEATEWDKVVLIPVLVTFDSSATTSGEGNIIRIQHDLKPGYARLKGGKLGDKLKLEVVSTVFGE